VYPSLVSSKASSIFGSKTTKEKRGGPIPENVIITLLNFLFPDAEKDQSVINAITIKIRIDIAHDKNKLIQQYIPLPLI